MGCDIHSRAERLEDDGVWRAVGAVFPYPYYREGEPTVAHTWNEETQKWEDRPATEEDLAIGTTEHFYVSNEPWTVQPFMQRNYRLFACLAGVRNGRGFAGVSTGNEVIPIDKPRGVPEDASPEWTAYVEDWGPDLHSASWLRLDELLAYDWARESLIVGVISEDEYLALKATNEPPQSWSGGVSGGTSIQITDREYEESVAPLRKLRDRLRLRMNVSIFVQTSWPSTLQRDIGPSFFETLDWLKRLHPDPARVRVVFGFDN